MAATVVDVIDPAEEPTIRRFRPKPTEASKVDPTKVVVSYDRPSDTLMIHLFGRQRDSVSVQAARNIYVLADPDTEEVVGVHVEGFLARMVRDAPEAIDILEHAELRGITPMEVRSLRSEALGRRQRLAAWLRSAHVRAPQERKRRALFSFLDPERSGLGSPAIPAIC